MAGYYVPLPGAEYPQNAMLNFAPLNNAITGFKNAQADNAMFDYKQKQDAIANKQSSARLGLAQQQGQREQTTFNQGQQDRQHQLLAATFQAISDAPPEQQPGMYAKVRQAIPGFDADVQSMGADPNDHANTIRMVMARAQGPQNPLDVQLKKTQIEQGQANAALARQGAEAGKVIPVQPGQELYSLKSGKFIDQPEGGNVVGKIADAIQKGNQAPTFTGLFRMAAPVRAELERRGVNVADMQNEWTRAQSQIKAVNGSQMTRYVGLTNSVDKTIDEANTLADQMQQSGIPLLNKAELLKLTQTQGNSEAGQLATRYLTAVNTLKEEFANLAQGGYAPTEPAWELANQQINANYGVKQLASSLGEIQRLMRYRLQAIPGINTVGPGAANRYIPGEEPPMGANHDAPQPKQAVAPPPGDYVYDPATGTIKPK